MRAAVWHTPILALVMLGAACVGPTGSPQQSAARPSIEQSGLAGKTKAITIGLSVPVDTIGILSQSAPTGGWIQLTELHSEGLITSEPTSRAPIGRLAEQVPSLDEETVAVLPDGRMRVGFTLRKDVTWHDGAPFTVGDLLFGYDFCCNPGVPNGFQDVTRFMSAIEAPDQSTLVIYYKSPSFQGANLGPHAFWPLPRHILEAPYERYLADRTSDEIFSLPYWTSEYVHLGPFRVSGYDIPLMVSLSNHHPSTGSG